MSSTIEEIVKGHSGLSWMMSRREKYQAEWEGSTNPALHLPVAPKVPMDYQTIRLALWTMLNDTCSKKNKKLHISEKASPKLTNILKNMVGDIESTYPPYKGIYLYGKYSCGKTWIMQHIANTLAKAHNTGWYDNTSPVFYLSYKTDITMRIRREKDISFISEIFKGKKIIFIDDLGYEDDDLINLYGTKERVVVHLIEILNSCYQSGATIHFTSNLQYATDGIKYAPNILEKYGQATHDRLTEMCTPVLWVSDHNLRTGK